MHHFNDKIDTDYEENGLGYVIDFDQREAILVKFDKNKDEIFIPSYIKYKDIEYPITNIGRSTFYNFKIKLLKFADDSKISFLSKYSFYRCTIYEINFPPSLKCVSREFFSFVRCIKVNLSTDNIYFKYIDSGQELIATSSKVQKMIDKYEMQSRMKNPRKLLFGEENTNDDIEGQDLNNDFDVLFFVNRFAKKVVIPSSIKIIDSGSFCHCFNLKTIEYEDINQITTIEANAFENCSFETFLFPPNIKTIEKCTFYRCDSLFEIKFTEDSKLETIRNDAFKESALRKITFPPKLANLESKWHFNTDFLNEIEISEKNRNFAYLEGYQKNVILSKNDDKSDIFDVICFVSCDLKKIKIPSFIKKIGPYSFCHRFNIKLVEFESNSSLISIEDGAFYHSGLKKISIPSNIKCIDTNAFYMCLNLVDADISNCLNLDKIERYAFYRCNVKHFTVPKNVTCVGCHGFSNSNAPCSFEFLADEISFQSLCFCNCKSLSIISLPNANKVNISKDSFTNVPNNFRLFVCSHAEVY